MSARLSDAGTDSVREAWRELFARLPPGCVQEARVIDVDTCQPEWTDTDIELRQGDWVTTLARGRFWPDGNAGQWLGARAGLWMRIGADGQPFCGSRHTHSFCAYRAGRLQFTGAMPESWEVPAGDDAISTDVQTRANADFVVAVLIWRAPTLRGLQRVVEHGDVDAMIAGEIDRIRSDYGAPMRWEFSWRAGPSEAFTQSTDARGRGAIRCRARAEMALLRAEHGVALNAHTRLAWTWRVDRLPHHTASPGVQPLLYAGVGVEFDGGESLRYVWSATLPVGRVVHSSVSGGHPRQALIVVRSGTRELGQPLQHERTIAQDWSGLQIGAPPQRVTHVTLLARALYPNQSCDMEFTALCIGDGSGDTPLIRPRPSIQDPLPHPDSHA